MSDYKYTQLGKNYFKARGQVEEFIAHIPVRITGRNSKGAMYTRMGVVPHTAIMQEPLQVPVAMSRAEKDEALKTLVLGRITGDILLEVSDEAYRYDANGNSVWEHELPAAPTPVAAQPIPKPSTGKASKRAARYSESSSSESSPLPSVLLYGLLSLESLPSPPSSGSPRSRRR